MNRDGSQWGAGAWRALDVDIAPGHYHFPAQTPRLSMRFRRAAVMRGYETELSGSGLAAATLTVHDRRRPDHVPLADSDLPHFDVDPDGRVDPRRSGRDGA